MADKGSLRSEDVIRKPAPAAGGWSGIRPGSSARRGCGRWSAISFWGRCCACGVSRWRASAARSAFAGAVLGAGAVLRWSPRGAVPSIANERPSWRSSAWVTDRAEPPRRMSPTEIRQLVDALSGLLARLCAADPNDELEIYRELGLS